MNFSGNFFRAFAIIAMLALNPALTHAQPTSEQTQGYVNAAQEFSVSDKDYDDLTTYMQRARELLDATIYEAQGLSGDELHDRLIVGIQAALAASELKQELLLFRYVLHRALELDTIFQRYSPVNQGKTMSATVVLLAHIRLAIAYYENDDIRRVKKGVMASPDWVRFAGDQIGVIREVIKRSPSPAAKFEIIKRALGWTARSLNSSFDRRTRPRQINLLAEMMKNLTLAPHAMSEAQHLLLVTQQELQGTTKAAPIAFPEANYPATSLKSDDAAAFGRGALFPLVKADTESSLGIANQDWYIRPSFSIAGGSALVIGGSDPRGYATASVNANLLMLHALNDTAAIHQAGAPYTISGEASLKVSGGQALSSGKPIYEVRAETSGNAQIAIFGVGVWAGLEARQYEQVKEQLARVGYMATAPFRFNNEDYVMLKLGIGAMAQNIEALGGRNGEKNASIQKVSEVIKQMNALPLDFRAAAVLKLSRFFVNVEAEYSVFKEKDNNDTSVTRLKLATSLSVPLGAIFKTDGIRVEGSHLSYKYSAAGDALGSPPTQADTARFSIDQLGVFYEFKW